MPHAPSSRSAATALCVAALLMAASCAQPFRTRHRTSGDLSGRSALRSVAVVGFSVAAGPANWGSQSQVDALEKTFIEALEEADLFRIQNSAVTHTDMAYQNLAVGFADGRSMNIHASGYRDIAPGDLADFGQLAAALGADAVLMFHARVVQIPRLKRGFGYCDVGLGIKCVVYNRAGQEVWKSNGRQRGSRRYLSTWLVSWFTPVFSQAKHEDFLSPDAGTYEDLGGQAVTRFVVDHLAKDWDVADQLGDDDAR